MSIAQPSRLLYHSRIAPGFDAGARARLLETSERRNGEAGLRSGLVAYRGVFMQALEGDIDEVTEVFRRLLVDPRHHGVTLVHLGAVEANALPPVRMAMLDEEEIVEELLAQHRAQPPFDPGALGAAAMTAIIRQACLARTFLVD
ncbi:BLUF domain-containing protein [Salinarimonas ramus]|uniref:BLUF domain-containing protein n=1 Tax=Salinarimonas ramus TaxID=690164 RepID=A0A917V6K5_9HYPH|nr:BLUF domain-containing protein [Salinarimonas ramus]GGK46392.1 hypothetical protein GCM10011322_36810 [Salinarimonas ramus]